MTNWRATRSTCTSITCAANWVRASSKRYAVWAIASGRPMVENKTSDQPAPAPQPHPRRCLRADLGLGGCLDAQRFAQPDDVFPRPATGRFGADGRRVAGAIADF